MSWFHRELNLGPLTPLTKVLPLEQWEKGNFMKEIVYYELELQSYEDEFFSAFFPLHIGLGVVRSARV